jgi:hypothetical protein
MTAFPDSEAISTNSVLFLEKVFANSSLILTMSFVVVAVIAS